MKYFLVTELQTCYTEYVVRASSVTEAKSKAKVIDQDVVELPGCPHYIKTNSYECSQISENTDPVVVNAIKTIEANYMEETPEPEKKTRKRRSVKQKDKEIDELVEYING
jgi:hypothetical protein